MLLQAVANGGTYFIRRISCGITSSKVALSDETHRREETVLVAERRLTVGWKDLTRQIFKDIEEAQFTG